jgi:hypothetical protein
VLNHVRAVYRRYLRLTPEGRHPDFSVHNC